MSASAFQQGAQIQLEGRPYTLLRKVDKELWQVEHLRTKRIEEFTQVQLHGLYAAGKLTFISDHAPGRIVSENPRPVEFSPEQWEAAKVRRAYVMAVIDLPSSRARIRAVIEETWRRLQQPAKAPGKSTVLRWKGRFLRAGKDITALFEQHAKKGNTSARYPAAVEEFVRRAIDKVYLTRERKSVEEALAEAQNLVLRENNLRPAAMQLPRPTRRLMTRMLSAIPAFDRYAARYGHTAAVKKFRAVLAHRTTAVPLERAEVDHTRLDLMVIDDRTGLPLGRPWLTVCIDDYSRCILGIYISFEPPSYFTVARCLKHALLPKVTIQQDYPAIRNAWAAHGIMRELVVDNGLEFHSSSLENACLSVGIEIHYAARKTPWFKGKIERFLGTLNRAVAHGVPGTTFESIFEKEEYDPSKNAIVRYRVLKEIVHLWISDVYHQKRHRALGVPPAAMWAKSIAPDEILVPDDPARLEAILGRSEQRRLTHKGIELYSLQYNSHELAALRRELGDTLDVDVRVDTSDLGQIIVFSPDRRRMFTVPALDAEYATGLSEYQHRVCKRYAAIEFQEYSPDAWLRAKAYIAELIESEFMHKKQKTRSRVARYRGESKPQDGSTPAPPLPRDSATPAPPAPETPVALGLLADHATAEAPIVASSSTRKFAPRYRDRVPAFTECEDEVSCA